MCDLKHEKLWKTWSKSKLYSNLSELWEFVIFLYIHLYFMSVFGIVSSNKNHLKVKSTAAWPHELKQSQEVTWGGLIPWQKGRREWGRDWGQGITQAYNASSGWTTPFNVPIASQKSATGWEIRVQHMSLWGQFIFRTWQRVNIASIFRARCCGQWDTFSSSLEGQTDHTLH